MGHAFIFQDSIGLPGTDGPRMGERSHFSNFPKQGSNQNENSFQLIGIYNMRRSTPLGGCFSVK